MHALPGAIVSPAPEVLIDNLPGWELMQQQAPRSATAPQIQDPVQDVARGVRRGPSAGLRLGPQRWEPVPLSVPAIGRGRLSGVHTPDDPRSYPAMITFLDTLSRIIQGFLRGAKLEIFMHG
jgi:hypothetical protein